MSPSQTLPDHLELAPEVHLLTLPEPRFKRVLLQVHFERPLDADTPARSLLAQVLQQGSAAYPSRRALARRQEELFGAGVGLDSGRVAESSMLSLTCGCVGERFLPQGEKILADVLGLGRELLEAPLRGAGGSACDADVFAREQAQMLRQIDARSDDRSAYAFYQFVRQMCADEPFARFTLGTRAEALALQPDDLERVRTDLLARAAVQVVAVGPFDRGALRAQLQEWFANSGANLGGGADCSNNRGGDSGGGAPPADPSRREVVARPQPVTPGALREFHQQMSIDQARLLLGFRFPAPQDACAMEAMVLANAVYGGGLHGRLFQVVREQRSLAYGISSSPYLVKGLMVVSAGIDAAAHAGVRDEVLHQAGEMAAGRIEEQELAMAKASILNGLRGLGDSAGSLARFHLREFRLGFQRSPEQRAAQIDAVELDQVAAAASTWQADCSYLLSGDDGPASAATSSEEVSA